MSLLILSVGAILYLAHWQGEARGRERPREQGGVEHTGRENELDMLPGKHEFNVHAYQLPTVFYLAIDWRCWAMQMTEASLGYSIINGE